MTATRAILHGTLAALVLGVAGFPQSVISETDASGAADVVITMHDDMSFDPPSVQVRAGAVIEWVNEGAVPHTTTARAGNAPIEQLPEAASEWDSGLLMSGERFRIRLDTPGEYRYVCTLHLANDMAGRIEVLPAGSD